MKILLDRSNQHFDQKLPFVLYKKPNNTNVFGVFQDNDNLFSVNDYTEKGFVFASFDGNKVYIIPENQSETIIANSLDFTHSKTENSEIFEQIPLNSEIFENLVSKGIQGIHNGEFKKVVVSRKETLKLDNFDLKTTFVRLVQLYPSTFVYCFYHPKVGFWFGATPEQLLKSNTGKFETIALAGTQKDQGQSEVIWHKKEKEEQQFVTEYIIDNLKDIASEIVVSSPYSVKAGSIWHIKTDISGALNTGFNLQKVIRLLHPTPAVCGLPKEESRKFILDNEPYNRTFYTGFLGELNRDNKTDLYVNLRCMEIEISPKMANQKAHLFMGCGITKDSIPEKEWEESVNKSATMKRVLEYRI